MRFFKARRHPRNTFLKSASPCPNRYCPYMAHLASITRYGWGKRGTYVCPAGHVRVINRHRY